MEHFEAGEGQGKIWLPAHKADCRQALLRHCDWPGVPAPTRLLPLAAQCIVVAWTIPDQKPLPPCPSQPRWDGMARSDAAPAADMTTWISLPYLATDLGGVGRGTSRGSPEATPAAITLPRSLE